MAIQTFPAALIPASALANVPTATFRGRATAGTGTPEDLTTTQATALLNTATTALKGLMAAADKIKADGAYKDIVADYGADPTGAVDATTIIQTAVNAFTASGGRLFFPVGTYKISSTITISKPVICCGAGRSISAISMSAATGDMFVMATGAQAAGFEQIRLLGASAGLRTAGSAVNFGAIPNVYMQQCDILFQWTGVISGGALQFLDDMNIREGGANAANGQAVLVQASGDRYIRRLTTDQGSNPTGYAAIRILECASCVIVDSNLIHSGNALDVVPNAGIGHAVASILSIDTFYDSSVIGANITCSTASDTTQRVRFINCWFSTHTTAGVVLGHANVNSVDFIGCDFYQEPFGIRADACTEWSVRSSRFAGCTTNAIRTTAGGTHSFTIADNFIGNGAGFGANAQGINVQVGAYARYQILDNRGLDTNTTPGIIDLGTVTYPATQKSIGTNLGVGLNLGPVATGVANLSVAATETEVVGLLMPANSLKVGSQFRFVADGLQTNTITGTTSLHKIHMGTVATALASRGTYASWSVSMGTVARTNVPFFLIADLVIITIGAGGTAWGTITLLGFSATAYAVPSTTITAAVAINTTVENQLSLSTASGGASTTWNYITRSLEVMN